MRRRCAALLGLLLLTAAAPPAERELSVANRSDRTINELYVSPVSSQDWGADRLGDVTIEPRRTRRLRIRLDSDHASSGECLFDVQIVYSDASREERRRVDLCHTRRLAFDASDAVAPAGDESGGHPVLIDNESELPIQQVLISPAEAGDWGDDRLAAGSISVGETQAVMYRGGCLADVRVVFENRGAEERRGLDLCALRGVTIRPGWTTAPRLEPPRPAVARTPPLPLSITVVNHAGRAIQELYLFEENASDHGPERLGSTPLDDGGQVVIDMLRPPGSCRYRARVVYGGKTPNQDLGALDVCHEPTLVVPPRG